MPTVEAILPTVQDLALRERLPVPVQEALCRMFLAASYFGGSASKERSLNLADKFRPKNATIPRALIQSRRELLSSQFQNIRVDRRRAVKLSALSPQCQLICILDLVQKDISNGKLAAAQSRLDATTPLDRNQLQPFALQRRDYAQCKIWRFLGKFEEAKAGLEDLWAQPKLPRHRATLVLSHLTAVRYELNILQKAIDELETHIHYAEVMGWSDLPRVHELHICLADGYLALDKVPKALQAYQKLEAHYFSGGRLGLYQKQLKMRLWFLVARSAHMREDWIRAADLWRNAYDDAVKYRFRSDEMIIAYSRAFVLRMLGDYQAAERFRNAAEEVYKNGGEHFWYPRIGTYWLKTVRQSSRQ